MFGVTSVFAAVAAASMSQVTSATGGLPGTTPAITRRCPDP
jgi:hypothetical protein